MEYPTNDQIFGNFNWEDEDLDAPEGFYDRYLERNCFKFLEAYVESDHMIENDSDLEQAEVSSKRRHKICRTTWLTKKPSIGKLQRCTSVNIVAQKFGTLGCARRAKTKLNVLVTLFQRNVRNDCFYYKQNYGAKLQFQKLDRYYTHWKHKQFLSEGLLLLHSVYHDTKQSVKYLLLSPE